MKRIQFQQIREDYAHGRITFGQYHNYLLPFYEKHLGNWA